MNYRLQNVLLLLFCLVILLPVGAHAQMPNTPVGQDVHIGPPWFEGVELIWSSNTVSCNNHYGNYTLHVLPGVVPGAPHNILSATHADAVVAALVVGDILYVDAGGNLNRLAAGAVGDVLIQGVAIPGWGPIFWEAANNYRGGAASLEPVITQDGIPMLVQDALAAQFLALIHDAVDANYDTSAGSHRFFMTGAGTGLQVHAPGIVPGVNLLRVDLRHSGAAGDGYLESITGNMGIRPANGSNVGVLDSTGGADDYYFPDGDGLVNQAMFTDGANQLDFEYEHSKTAFQTCLLVAAIDNTVIQAVPTYFTVDLIQTTATHGIRQCRDGSVTGISIACTGVVENPATTDQVRCEVYINGVSTGFGVAIDGAIIDAEAVQAVLTDQFVAGDELTIGAWYSVVGGPASSITISDVLGVIEVHYD